MREHTESESVRVFQLTNLERNYVSARGDTLQAAS